MSLMLRLRPLVYEKLKADAVGKCCPSVRLLPQPQQGLQFSYFPLASLGNIIQNHCAFHSVEAAWSSTPCLRVNFNTIVQAVGQRE